MDAMAGAEKEAKHYLGTTVGGRWLIERVIGRGGFAWVYFATSRGEEAAVKILHDPRPTSALRFDREIKVLRALPPNPYVTRYIEHGMTEDGRHYLALEYVEGSTLGAWMKQGARVDPPVAVDLIVQISRAFTGLHELGVAHRDVKPANILLPDRGGIKLVDFGLIRDAQGLLKLLEEDDPLQARVFDCDIDQWLLIGTPEYMAPEQFSDALSDGGGQEQTDTWSDVFSLGVILFQLIEGKLPFPLPRPAREMDHQTYIHYARWRAYLADEETPICPQVEPNLRAIIRKTLRRDPRRRPRDARQLESELVSFMQSEDWETEEESLTVQTSPSLRRSAQDVTDSFVIVNRRVSAEWDEDSPTRELGPNLDGESFTEMTPVERIISVSSTRPLRDDATMPIIKPSMSTNLVVEEMPTTLELSGSLSSTREATDSSEPWEPDTLVDRSMKRVSSKPSLPRIRPDDDETKMD